MPLATGGVLTAATLHAGAFHGGALGGQPLLCVEYLQVKKRSVSAVLAEDCFPTRAFFFLKRFYCPMHIEATFTYKRFANLAGNIVPV